MGSAELNPFMIARDKDPMISERKAESRVAIRTKSKETKMGSIDFALCWVPMPFQLNPTCSMGLHKLCHTGGK